MSVYIIDKCERFVSQRAGCGKAASPDSVRGVRPQGVRLLDTQENQYLSGRAVLNCGDDTATEVDHEVMILLHNSYEEAKRLIGSHREALDKIAAYLIRRETITGKEFMKIFHAVERGIEIPENLDDLVIPEEKQNTVTLDKPEIQ